MRKTTQMIPAQNTKTMEMIMTILINLPHIPNKTNQGQIKIQEQYSLKNMIMSMIILLRKMQRNLTHQQQHPTIQKKSPLKEVSLSNLSPATRKKIMKKLTIQWRKKASKRSIDKINYKFKSTTHLNLKNVEWVVEECLILIA